MATTARSMDLKRGMARLYALPLVAFALLWTVPIGAGVTVCPFALLTGTACPGCGMTRAAASLARGDLAAALTYHPLIVVVGAWAGAAWLLRVRGRRDNRSSMSPRTLNALLAITAAAFLITWAIRWAQGSLPPV